MTDQSLKTHLDYFRSQAAGTKKLRAYLYRRLAVGTRRRGLDVGCGDGWLTAELAGKVKEEAVGCDVAPEMVKAAQEANPTLTFLTSQPTELPFAKGSFDFVCCHFTLLWAPEPVASTRCCRT